MNTKRTKDTKITGPLVRLVLNNSFCATREGGGVDLAQDDGKIVGVKPRFHGADGQAAEGTPAD